MRTKLLAVLALVVMVFGVTAAYATVAPVMFIYDVGTGTGMTITDGGVGDSNSAVGVITYIGSFGNFAINVDTGQVGPPLAAGHQDLHFAATADASLSGTDTLQVYFTGLNYVPAGASIGVTGTIGGTTDASGIEWAAGFSDLNVACTTSGCSGNFTALWDTTLSGTPFSGSQYAGFSPANPYSLVQAVAITESATQSTTGDFSLAVPEPASMTLLGAGLLGLFGTIRRRRNG